MQHDADNHKLDQRMTEVRALADQFTELIAAAPTHVVGLEALLLSFIAVARLHPCCTQESANAAMRVSMLLARQAASQTKQPVH